MPAEARTIISEQLGVEPIEINSALFSAQARKRLYWTNIPLVKDFPKSNAATVASILEKNADAKYEIHPLPTAPFSFTTSKRKHNSLVPVRIGKLGAGGQGHRVYSIYAKGVTLNALGGGRGANTGLYMIDEKIRKLMPIECERLQTLPDNYTVAARTDAVKYRVIGNGWTVNVITWLLSNIQK